MGTPTTEEIRKTVRDTYGDIARAGGSGCSCGCASGDTPTAEESSTRVGYTDDDLSAAPDGANLGLGCGNPQAIASLKPGETVVDLGSGGGFDCFLAARAVGETGRVIGVDMTPEMIGKARGNADESEFGNVEFRLGEIEHLPVADDTADAIISNCVINLSPEKPDVFREAFRVLKPGGRLAVADIVATGPLPDEVKADLTLHAGCMAGAVQTYELASALAEAGFVDVRIQPIDGSGELIQEWSPGADLGDLIVSARIEARKPER